MSRRVTVRESIPSLFRTIRHFWPYLRRHRMLIAGSMSALLAGVALRALEPWPIKVVFDEVLAMGFNGDPSAEAGPLTLLTLAAGALVLILALRAITTYANKVGFALIGSFTAGMARGS